jgi:hypothetical protein
MLKRSITCLVLIAFSMTASGQTPVHVLRLRFKNTGTSSLTTLHQANITYQGGFKVPTTPCGGDDLQFSGTALTFKPSTNTILMTDNAINVVELTIPALVNSATLANLNTATCVRNAGDPTEGLKVQGDLSKSDSEQFAEPYSFAVLGSNLWTGLNVFYDSNGPTSSQKLSLTKRPSDLTVTGSSHGVFGTTSTAPGWYPQMAAQQVALISSDWTTAMGGDLFVGKFAGNVVTSMSWGPAATVVNSLNLTASNGVLETTISVANGDNSFNDSANTLPAFAPGDTIVYRDQDNSANANNGVWTVSTSTSSKLVVTGGTVTTVSAANHVALSRVYAASKTPLYATSGRGPSGACATSTGDNILNGVTQCGDGFGGWPGGTRGSTYKYWSSADYDGGLVQPKGTRTLIVTGVHGAGHSTYGGYGYGCGCGFTVATPGQLTCNGGDGLGCGATGEGYFYDPEHSTDKGNHGFPYDYMFRLYDMVDLQNAVLGSKDPRDIVPYEFFTITFPVMPNSSAGEQTRFSNPGYDSVNQLIYIAQQHGPNNIYPIIQVFKVTP